MQAEKSITVLFKKYFGYNPLKLEKLPQAGSSRTYYRLTAHDSTAIGVAGTDAKENRRFIELTHLLAQNGINTPRILAVGAQQSTYLISDLGNMALLDFALAHKTSNGDLNQAALLIYKDAINQLVVFQNLKPIIKLPRFDQMLIFSDLEYFKFYFLKINNVVFDDRKLMRDFTKLSKSINYKQAEGMMYRDFQARNIMVHEHKAAFIDYQGAMLGPGAYDLSSLLYQAKAQLTQSDRNQLAEYYHQLTFKNSEISFAQFNNDLKSLVLVRILQTLGAYGLRGLIERKPHFISSIVPALLNLKQHFKSYHVQLPELKRVIDTITSDDFCQKFKHQAASKDKLLLTITSFSFKKGYPIDMSGNGGGFVFDCRGIENPGRYEPYKLLTGLDKEVIDFLEQKTSMPSFVSQAYEVVKPTVENYIQRGFASLCISTGCTGGQHRSVYLAQKLANKLKKDFDVQIIVNHREQSIVKKIGF